MGLSVISIIKTQRVRLKAIGRDLSKSCNIWSFDLKKLNLYSANWWSAKNTSSLTLVPKPSSISTSIIWELNKNGNSQISRLTESETSRVGPSNLCFNKPSRDSGPHLSLGITGLENWGEGHMEKCRSRKSTFGNEATIFFGRTK